jgi:nicotinamidase-related amidase
MVDKYTSADWQNAALLTIDTQNDFTLSNSPFAITGTFEIVPKMSQVLHAFRIAGKPIIHVIRIYNADGSNVDLCRRRAIAELGKKLVITGTLEKHLRDLHTNTVVICGCNFPNCPRTTVYEASERDFRVVLIKDATSNVYEHGLHELNKIGVELMTSDDCIAALK